MIPEHRLVALLDEVKAGWIANCLYHNTAASPSLYIDHSCERDEFPMKTVMELRNHKDEVWYLKFSNDGSKLASASRDRTIVIYDTATYKVLHRLDDHGSGVSHVAWSPDDSKLLSSSGSQEDQVVPVWWRYWLKMVLAMCSQIYPPRSIHTLGIARLMLFG